MEGFSRRLWETQEITRELPCAQALGLQTLSKPECSVLSVGDSTGSHKYHIHRSRSCARRSLQQSKTEHRNNIYV